MAVSFEYVVPEDKIVFFRGNGFCILEDVITPGEIDRYVNIVTDMLEGRISTRDKRGDLGGHAPRINEQVENTVQIVHPYILTSQLDECELYRKGAEICDQLYGSGSFGLDCSQIVVKLPRTRTETPWHQDQSYYPSALEDKRAANVWLALEDATEENGCLWFHPVPISSSELSPHHPAGSGRGALTCKPPAGEATCAPMRRGSLVVFNNYTYHYGGPNQSGSWRPALVAQYRPRRMIQACRQMGFDHGKFASNEEGTERTKRVRLSQS